MRPVLLSLVSCLVCWPCAAAQVAARNEAPSATGNLEYRLAHPALKLVRIDAGVEESFVAVRVDSAGRIFVGGREGLFVYEPDAQGGYQPRRELYRFPEESWVFDLAILGHDIYALTASALYVLPGAVTQREGLQPKRILWGQPRGHIQLGFHGLTIGPEGDLYCTMGDPLQHYGDFNRPDHWGHWTLFGGPDNAPTPYTGAGAVLRCRPDGSGLQVVARGVFASFGLTFDRHWQLFSSDNDREAMPFRYVPARMLHITPHADFGWPRGWMPSKTPERSDLLETLYEGLGRDAPVGMTYYDETFLPPPYRGHLLLARWAQRKVSRHSLRPRGASFVCDEQPLLEGTGSARPLGVCVGRGGRIFATIGYMPNLEGSPRYRSDLVMITKADDSATHPFRGYDAATAPEDQLWAELSQPSWHQRQQAHLELLRRGRTVLQPAAKRLASARAGDSAVEHLIWLAAASGTQEASERLVQLARGPDAALRLSAVRALTEFAYFEAVRPLTPSLSPGGGEGARRAGEGVVSELREKSSLPRRTQLAVGHDVFVRALHDNDPQVRHAAALAFFKLSSTLPEEIIQTLARSDDTYLRQTAAFLLADRATVGKLEQLCRAPDIATRLAGVLAAGFRLTLPPATAAVPAQLPLSPFPDSANVIQFADAKLDLRKFGRVGNFTMAEYWKAVPHTSEQEQLFALLLKVIGDANERVSVQAAHFLSLLNDPRSEPAVTKAITASEERRLEGAPVSILKRVASAWIVGPFPDGVKGLRQVHPPEQGPVDLAATFTAGPAQLSWKQANPGGGDFNFTELLQMPDNASCYAHFVFESAVQQSIMLFVGSNDGVKVWHDGRPVWEHDTVRRALLYNDMVLLRLQRGGNHILIRVHNADGDSGLFINYKALGPVSPRLPEKIDANLLAQRLKDAGSGTQPTAVPEEFLRVNWPQVVAKGDPQHGRQLFDTLACGKCHAVGAEQVATVGPSLAEASRRFTVAHLVESILLPSQQVSPMFRQTLVVTRDGEELAGLIVSETGDQLELVLPDASRRTIPTKTITVRRQLELSPMPAGLVTKPEELRDLLAYLLAPAKPQ